MNKDRVLEFIGKERAAKLEALDVFTVMCSDGKKWVIDAISLDEWTDADDCHTFFLSGIGESNLKMMVSFRNWIDHLNKVEEFKKGDRVRWLEEVFPDGSKLYHYGEIESFWGYERDHRLWWVLPDRRSSSQSMFEGKLELVALAAEEKTT